jgi:hypothetical protein
MSISASTLTHKNKPLTRRIFNGRTVRFRTLFLILMTLILASFVRPTSVKAQAEDSGLEGTWLNDVKIVACAPAPPIVFARFQSMSTYMRGGTLIEGGSPPAPAVSRSAGHGIWERTGGHTFRVFFRFHTFDSLGRLVSIFEVTSNPSLVNGELSGPGTAAITNLNPDDGTVINVIDVCNVATSRPVLFEN